MRIGESWEAGGPIVNVGVVLHRAGAQRVAGLLGADIEFGERLVVVADFVFRQVRESRVTLAEKGVGDFREGYGCGGDTKLLLKKGDEAVTGFCVCLVGETEHEEVVRDVG